MIDKTNWPQGSWMDEPDEKQGEYKGYLWFILRHPLFGTLRGYVYASSTHPFYEIAQQKKKDNEDNWYPDFDVHGGITHWNVVSYSPDKNLHFVVLGFDCGHFNDLYPATPNRHKDALKKLEQEGLVPEHPLLKNPPVEYRDMAYVQKECEKLIDQLIEQEKGTE